MLLIPTCRSALRAEREGLIFSTEFIYNPDRRSDAPLSALSQHPAFFGGTPWLRRLPRSLSSMTIRASAKRWGAFCDRSAQVRVHGSVPEFLKAGRPDGPTCLVLDVRLPGQGGLDFQRELSQAGFHLPIIFITGHGDIPMSVQAMKGGAIAFMTKPFREQDLLDAIHLGLEQDRARRKDEEAISARFFVSTAVVWRRPVTVGYWHQA